MTAEPSITCPCCQAVSCNRDDIAQRYCGKCHDWTGDPGLGARHMARRCPHRPVTGDCVFCGRIDRGEYDDDLSLEGSVAVFEPLNPVTPGHLLLVPFEHVRDAGDKPHVTGMVMEHAGRLLANFTSPAEGPYQANIITSIGPAATQSVFHLHAHIVPRHPDDGLALPWTGQKERQQLEQEIEDRWVYRSFTSNNAALLDARTEIERLRRLLKGAGIEP